MSVKGPSSPLSSGAEPLEPLSPNELQKVVKGGQFESQLAALDAAASDGAQGVSGETSESVNALRQIASGANLENPAEALGAIKESARFMISSRIQENFRQSEQGGKLVEDLSNHVATDPLLQRKMLRILERLKKE